MTHGRKHAQRAYRFNVCWIHLVSDWCPVIDAIRILFVAVVWANSLTLESTNYMWTTGGQIGRQTCNVKRVRQRNVVCVDIEPYLHIQYAPCACVYAQHVISSTNMQPACACASYAYVKDVHTHTRFTIHSTNLNNVKTLMAFGGLGCGCMDGMAHA